MADADFKDLPRGTSSEYVYIIKHLILLKIKSMMDIREVWSEWCVSFFIKHLQVLLFIQEYELILRSNNY